MEEKKEQGFLHDDEGNFDDRRLAGWFLLIATIAFGIIGVLRDSNNAVQLFQAGTLATAGLMGATVAEKFARK